MPGRLSRGSVVMPRPFSPSPFSPSPCLCLRNHRLCPVLLCLLSRMCSPQWQQETVTRDDLDLAVSPLSDCHQCCCVRFVVAVMVMDAASSSRSDQAPVHCRMWAFYSGVQPSGLGGLGCTVSKPHPAPCNLCSRRKPQMICSWGFLTLSPLGILGAGGGELVGERSLSHKPGSALSPELKLFCG